MVNIHQGYSLKVRVHYCYINFQLMGSYHVNATHCVLYYILIVVSVPGSLGFRVTKSKGKAENKFVSYTTFKPGHSQIYLSAEIKSRSGLGTRQGYNIVPCCYHTRQ